MRGRGLSRNADGTMIHRSDCRYARGSWRWADRATDDELLRSKLIYGLRVCKVCKPDFRTTPEEASE